MTDRTLSDELVAKLKERGLFDAFIAARENEDVSKLRWIADQLDPFIDDIAHIHPVDDFEF